MKDTSKCQAIRLCTVSARLPDDCTLHHDGLGCTTGLYKLDGGIRSPIDDAVDQVLRGSHSIARDIYDGAYTHVLIRHVLREAVSVGAVRLTDRH